MIDPICVCGNVTPELIGERIAVCPSCRPGMESALDRYRKKCERDDLEVRLSTPRYASNRALLTLDGLRELAKTVAVSAD